MDGHDSQLIVMSSLYDPVGLTLDFVMDRIYWADKFKSSIETATIDGRERYFFHTGSPEVNGSVT